MNHRFKKAEPNRGQAIASAICGVMIAVVAPNCVAAQPDQTTFPSAEAGSRALFLAVRDSDETALKRMLGAGEELVSSGDTAQDKLERRNFVQKYQEMHRVAPGPAGDSILYIGAENWPFPVPLAMSDGAWRFDPQAGKQEVLYRLIGENEATAIEVCRQLALAVEQAPNDHAPDKAVALLLGELRRSKKPVLFHAYDFRMLANAGSVSRSRANASVHDSEIALIAYPEAYRTSGVMSFIADHDGRVYQKDLGPDTAKDAATLKGASPDPTWAPVSTEP